MTSCNACLHTQCIYATTWILYCYAIDTTYVARCAQEFDCKYFSRSRQHRKTYKAIPPVKVYNSHTIIVLCTLLPFFLIPPTCHPSPQWMHSPTAGTAEAFRMTHTRIMAFITRDACHCVRTQFQSKIESRYKNAKPSSLWRSFSWWTSVLPWFLPPPVPENLWR